MMKAQRSQMTHGANLSAQVTAGPADRPGRQARPVAATTPIVGARGLRVRGAKGPEGS